MGAAAVLRHDHCRGDAGDRDCRNDDRSHTCGAGPEPLLDLGRPGDDARLLGLLRAASVSRAQSIVFARAMVGAVSTSARKSVMIPPTAASQAGQMVAMLQKPCSNPVKRLNTTCTPACRSASA